MSFFKKILSDIKTYYKIKSIYPVRYKDSTIESYIVDESILGKGLIIKKNVVISPDLKSIGNYSYIGDNTEIMNCVSIGNYCSISHGVKIGLENHALNHIGTSPVFFKSQRGWIESDSFPRESATVVESDVLVSANAMIMSGVKIGVGAVVGAGAFVNDNVPPYAIVSGVPAKIIRYRFDENTIEKLLATKWWEKDKSALIEYKEHFSNITEFIANYNGNK